jgi:hypothetical protein
LDIPNQEKYRENSKKRVDIDTRRVLKKRREMNRENLVRRQPILIIPVDDNYMT